MTTANSFEALMAQRNRSADQIKKDAEAVNQAANPSSFERDGRFWRLTVKDKKGEAVIRFLPNVSGTPIVRRDAYFVKTNKGSFFCHAPESYGVKSFPREVATACWAKFKETNDTKWKELFKARAAKQRYVTNILVIDDKGNPENNGKVFLFEFTPQVYAMIMDAQGLEVEGKRSSKSLTGELSLLANKKKQREEFDPFDMWTGADFAYIAAPSTGEFFSYENSFFMDNSELFEGDTDKLRELYESAYDLSEVINVENAEDYDELKLRYIEQTGDYYDLFPEKMQEAQAAAPSVRQNSIESRLGLSSTSSAASAGHAPLVTANDKLPWEENDKSEADNQPAKATDATDENDIDAVLKDLGV